MTVDAMGVLLLPDPSFLRRALADFGAKPDDATCWRAHYEMVHLLDQTADPDYAEMNRSYAAALGVPPSHREEAGNAVAEVYVGTPWVAAPGAAEALARLVEGGYGVAVVSNSMHGEVERLLSSTELCSTSGRFAPVAAVVDSQVVGVRKPDPRIFELAISALGADRSSCIHVGDSLLDDVMGARAAGLTPVHVDPLARCSAEDHAHVRSLLDVVDELLS